MSKERRVSLVLSIFKGVNFVCKKPNGYKLQITAKVGQQEMLSGCTQLVPTDSEPQFNIQLAWSFSEREWKVIRSRGEAVKVNCILTNEKNNFNAVLGYCTLHVKDAFLLQDFNEIDPSNAHTSPLLGLKDPWKMYSPKLQLLLHFEDSSMFSKQSPSKSLKSTDPSKSVKGYQSGEEKSNINLHISTESLANSLNASKFALDENAKDKIQFPFRINSEAGYFELGSLSEDDDLHTLNITIISGTNLHLLPFSENKSSLWVVEYKAYGCVIKTDPFKLALEEDNSRTFIGDKAQARLRANSLVFWNYIKNTSIEFQLLRCDEENLCNRNLLGVGFVDLQELSSPGVCQLKYTLELVSEHDYFLIDSQLKPEIRVLVELETIPNFFSTWKQANEPHLSNNSQMRNIDLSNVSQDLPIDPSVDLFATCDSAGMENNVSTNEIDPKKNSENNVAEIVGKMEKMELEKSPKEEVSIDVCIKSPIAISASAASQDPTKSPNHVSVKCDNVKTVEKSRKSLHYQVQMSPEITDNCSEPPSSPFQEDKENQSPLTDTYSTDKYNSANMKLEINGKQMTVISPGSYTISIKLSKIFVKTRYDVDYSFQLSYTHPPLSIQTPVVSFAHHDPSITSDKPNSKCFVVSNGTCEITFVIPSFSEDLLGDPLKVTILRSSTNNKDFQYFGFSSIPIGNIFLRNSKAQSQGQEIRDGASFYDKRMMRIGKLEYVIQLVPCDFSERRQLTVQYQNEDVVDADTRTTIRSNGCLEDRSVNSTVEFKMWKEKEEQRLKKQFLDKEKAYLKILSAEWKKRETERKKFIEDLKYDLTKQQREIEKQSRILAAKEKDLNGQELQLQNATRQSKMDQEYVQQENEIKMKRLQDNLQSEIDTLQRKNSSLNAELKSLKGKELLLEQKLGAKEERIRQLIDSRTLSPNSELVERVTRLELENEALRKDLKKAEKEGLEFKNQAKSLLRKISEMQLQKDMMIKDENENLKLQILASKEQKEMRKERKEIKGLSNQLREYKEKTQTKQEQQYAEKKMSYQLPNVTKSSREFPGASCGDSPTVGQDREVLKREINRLQQQREGLLASGCYNNYDQVVKEMGDRIKMLANRASQ